MRSAERGQRGGTARQPPQVRLSSAVACGAVRPGWAARSPPVRASEWPLSPDQRSSPAHVTPHCPLPPCYVSPHHTLLATSPATPSVTKRCLHHGGDPCTVGHRCSSSCPTSSCSSGRCHHQCRRRCLPHADSGVLHGFSRCSAPRHSSSLIHLLHLCPLHPHPVPHAGEGHHLPSPPHRLEAERGLRRRCVVHPPPQRPGQVEGVVHSARAERPSARPRRADGEGEGLGGRHPAHTAGDEVRQQSIPHLAPADDGGTHPPHQTFTHLHCWTAPLIDHSFFPLRLPSLRFSPRQSLPSFLSSLLGPELIAAGAATELSAYLDESFGNQQRIDYGTGQPRCRS